MEPHCTTWDVTWLDDVDSTNTWLGARAAAGAPDRSAVVARHQHAGRGRLDRTWEAPPDSAVLLSALLRPRHLTPRDWHLLTFAMALAVTDVAGPRTALKWPNDVIVPELGDRKLAGILAEAVHPAKAVIVGVGINRARPADPPPVLIERAAWLDELSVALEAEAVVGAVLARLDEWRDRLDGPAGGPAGAPAAPGSVLDEYRRRCTTIGREVTVQLHDGELRGRAVAVDDGGALVVEDGEGGLHRFNAGDVVHATARG